MLREALELHQRIMKARGIKYWCVVPDCTLGHQLSLCLAS
eukprot:SAG22_NODE_361_length_11712_cov_6.108155_5_plen_40_part_00